MKFGAGPVALPRLPMATRQTPKLANVQWCKETSRSARFVDET